MKHFLLNKAGEGEAGGGAAAPDVTKVVSEGFKDLKSGLEALAKRIEAQEKKSAAPAPKPKAKVEEDDSDLADEILVNPSKAVKKITEKVQNELETKFSSQSQAQSKFSTKFNDLASDYPELADQKSELHQRAKALLGEITDKEWDAGALEQAVFRAVNEKGVLPMKHRKQDSKDDDEGDDYLGSGSSYSRSESGRKREKTGKLDPRTLAFAELAGLNVSDAKVVDRLTKTQNERRGSWNKYR